MFVVHIVLFESVCKFAKSVNLSNIVNLNHWL